MSTGDGAQVHHLRGEQQPQRRGMLREWPILLVLIAVTVSLLFVAMNSFRQGSVMLAGSILLAAFLRLLLSDTDAGLLAVRTKRTDVLVLLVLGFGLAIFAFWVPPPPA